MRNALFPFWLLLLITFQLTVLGCANNGSGGSGNTNQNTSTGIDGIWLLEESTCGGTVVAPVGSVMTITGESGTLSTEASICGGAITLALEYPSPNEVQIEFQYPAIEVDCPVLAAPIIGRPNPIVVFQYSKSASNLTLITTTGDGLGCTGGLPLELHFSVVTE